MSENYLKFNNRLLKHIAKLTGNDLILYGVLLRYNQELTTSKLIEKLTSRATGKPCMSKSTMLKGIAKLRKLGFINGVETLEINLLM